MHIVCSTSFVPVICLLFKTLFWPCVLSQPEDKFLIFDCLLFCSLNSVRSFLFDSVFYFAVQLVYCYYKQDRILFLIGEKQVGCNSFLPSEILWLSEKGITHCSLCTWQINFLRSYAPPKSFRIAYVVILFVLSLQQPCMVSYAKRKTELSVA